MERQQEMPEGQAAPLDPEEEARQHEKEEFRRQLMGRIGAVVISVLVVVLALFVGWLQPIISVFGGVGMFMAFSWLWEHLPAIREAIDRKKR